MFETAVLLAGEMERGLTSRGLTRARATVIWQLRYADPMTQRDLSAAIGVTPRNITSLLDILQEAGFVARNPHPLDRRATLVTLTRRGKAEAAALEAEYRELADFIFGDLTAGSLAGFCRGMDHVIARLRDPGLDRLQRETMRRRQAATLREPQLPDRPVR
ncbi:MAG: MarR family transcriptional regulator [Actinobacteria bacterium]|nr:MarR family transcriptional regulator [Actinomycetota bacterium]